MKRRFQSALDSHSPVEFVNEDRIAYVILWRTPTKVLPQFPKVQVQPVEVGGADGQDILLLQDRFRRRPARQHKTGQVLMDDALQGRVGRAEIAQLDPLPAPLIRVPFQLLQVLAPIRGDEV